MNPLLITILAILQGVTEFLPVSSSGHLVAAQHFLGLTKVPILFDLVLHLGTLAATLMVYYREVWQLLKALVLWPFRGSSGRETELRMVLYLALGTAVTALIGFLLRDRIVSFFYEPRYLPLFFFLTGCLLLGTRFVRQGGRSAGQMDAGRSAVIGLAQSAAMLPGISRSGSTIATGLYLGLNREFAAAFSFLLSIPSILGASLVEALSGEAAEVSPGLLFYGFVLALLVGYGALRLLLTTLKQSRIHLFSFYCFAAALFLLLIQLSNG